MSIRAAHSQLTVFEHPAEFEKTDPRITPRFPRSKRFSRLTEAGLAHDSGASGAEVPGPRRRCGSDLITVVLRVDRVA